MVVGRIPGDEKFWCFPLDIESGLDDFKLVAQTLLIPSSIFPNAISGFQSLLSTKSKCSPLDMAAMCSGYLTCFDLLESQRIKITNLLTRDFLSSSTPSRVILRATKRYKEWQTNRIDDQLAPFCPAEIEQLERGDIPYFFRYLNSQALFVLDKDAQPVASSVPDELMKKHRDYLPVGFPFAYRFRQSLRQAGVLQLARSFLERDICGSSEFANIKIEITPNHISINDGNQIFASQRIPASRNENNE
jgi:hypothetical protein